MSELIPEVIRLLNRQGHIDRGSGEQSEKESFQTRISTTCKGMEGCVRVPSFLRMRRASV